MNYWKKNHILNILLGETGKTCFSISHDTISQKDLWQVTLKVSNVNTESVS